jgi:hypothetical protein
VNRAATLFALRKCLLLALTLLCGSAGDGRTAEAVAAPEPRFIDVTVAGWRVKLNADFQQAQPKLARQAMALLRKELAAIAATVPRQRLGQLRRATIWLDERVPTGPDNETGPVFHFDRTWLETHGLDPDMAGGVEIPNAQRFLDSYSWEPWVIMHELAHFYHRVVLGDGNAIILRAYQHARDAHLYERVLHYDGKMLPAYALKNELEYFAELTESYFGRNDYYPFTRAELQEYDPSGFAMMQQIWEAP